MRILEYLVKSCSKFGEILECLVSYNITKVSRWAFVPEYLQLVSVSIAFQMIFNCDNTVLCTLRKLDCCIQQLLHIHCHCGSGQVHNVILQLLCYGFFVIKFCCVYFIMPFDFELRFYVSLDTKQVSETSFPAILVSEETKPNNKSKHSSRKQKYCNTK